MQLIGFTAREAMKYHPTSILPILLLAASAAAELKDNEPRQSADWRPPIEVDADTLEVLRKINSASAYEVPDLGLREDENYAYTSHDVSPFRHVQPFKERLSDERHLHPLYRRVSRKL